MFTRPGTNSYIRSLLDRLVTSVLAVVTCVLLAGLALSPAETARAQASGLTEARAVSVTTTSALRATSTHWRTHFDEQAAEVLRGQGSGSQKVVMRLLIVGAEMDQPRIDLSAAVPALLEVARDGVSEERRMMALQALGAIGTEHCRQSLYPGVIERLHRIAQEESSDRFRRAAADVLLNFYAEAGA